MTIQVNVQEAKTQLSRLLSRAVNGEEIVIARDGAPLVRLTPITAPPNRELGFVTYRTPDSFLEPLSDDELDLWT